MDDVWRGAFRIFCKQDAPATLGRHLIRTMLGMVKEMHSRQLDQEITLTLARSGGRFTDAIELEMYQRHIFKPTWGCSK